MKVLNFGSLNIDYVYSLDHIVQKGETISSERLEIYSGGKGLNQSIALGRAGVKAYHAGAVGRDGIFLKELLTEAGVRTEFVRELDAVRTGNAIIQRDRGGDNCIILYGGANQSIKREQVDETLGCFEAGDYIVLQNEINEMGYIMERAHERGMKLVLNPSPMDEKILSLPLAFADIFILNEIEACQLLAVPENRRAEAAACGEELLCALSGRFPEAMIVLTLGKKGSVCIDGRAGKSGNGSGETEGKKAVNEGTKSKETVNGETESKETVNEGAETKETVIEKAGSKEAESEEAGSKEAGPERRIIKQPAYLTETVDTTAAGDTFTGYFVSGLMRGLTVQESMDLAARAAAVAVSGLGAAPSIPTLDQVEKTRFQKAEDAGAQR